jgi:phosphatidylglycerol lysyltransferase
VSDERHAARALIFAHGWNAAAYQILNPGMTLWFSRSGDAVAGYARYHRTWVIAGAPVCAAERLAGVAREISADATARGCRVLYFGAGERLERLFGRRMDHARMLLGSQPVWQPREWHQIVARKASLRAQLHRAANKGVVVREWIASRASSSLALRRILGQWLAARRLPPLGFMVTPDLLDHLADRRVFVAELDSEPCAFLVATPIPARAGWLVEQWPRALAAPNGTTQLMVDAAMRAFASEHADYATLGLAPLSHEAVDEGVPSPRWLRLTLRWVRDHGRRFYNFAGLEAFKTGLQPASWEPVFAIAQGPRFRPSMLLAIAGVFGGGRPFSLVTKALARV